jgi:hypothetical protein
MGLFFATRQKLSTTGTLGQGLRALYSVPEDMPDAFAKLFEKLDSAPKLKPVIKANRENKPAQGSVNSAPLLREFL